MVTVRKTTTRSSRSEVGKGVENVMKQKNLISDDAVNR
jgi:hypothetical protein